MLWIRSKSGSRKNILTDTTNSIFFSKQQFKKENPIDWEKTKCAICNYHLPAAASNFPCEKITTSLDLVISKGHSFVRNIFDYEDLKLPRNIAMLEKYHEAFKQNAQNCCFVEH